MAYQDAVLFIARHWTQVVSTILTDRDLLILDVRSVRRPCLGILGSNRAGAYP